jgi:hypothetical protein
MNLKQTIATGALTVIAFSALTFMPANADSTDNSAPAVIVSDASVNPAETPQHLVWDMTYGDQAPAITQADETVVAELPQDEVRDLSMG